ncbi:MAG: YraN family protein [Patescibacteria group bacterium]
MIGNQTGKLGEDLAEKYLKDKGFEVLHRNYWKPYGEIDIICEKVGKTHFIEVKSVSCVTNNRISHENIRPEENIHDSKLKKLARVIRVYISVFHVKSWQFDVMIVYIDKKSKKAEVRVLENQILEE